MTQFVKKTFGPDQGDHHRPCYLDRFVMTLTRTCRVCLVSGLTYSLQEPWVRESWNTDFIRVPAAPDAPERRIPTLSH